MSKKLLTSLVVAVSVLCVGILINVKKNFQASRLVPDNIIRLGTILPLTGLVAADGQASLLGAKLACEEINKIPNAEYKLELEILDGKYETKDTLSAFKFMTNKSIDGMLLMGEMPNEILASQLSNLELPTFATVVGSRRIIDLSDWNLRAWIPVARIANIMAMYARQRVRAKTAAIFCVDSEYGEESANSFMKKFQGLGGEVLLKESFAVTAVDARNSVAKIMNARPDIVYITGYAQGYISSLNQLKTTGYEGQILTDMVISDPQVSKNIKDCAGILYTAVDFGADAKNDAYKGYEQMYKNKYGENPYLISAIHYESVKILYRALAKHKKNRKEALDEIRSGITYSTAMGPISFAKNGEISLPIFVRKYIDNVNSSVVDDKLYSAVETE